MRAIIITLSVAALIAPATASAEQTQITVRVLAKDFEICRHEHGGHAHHPARCSNW